MKSLTEADARHYHDLGYYAPVPVLARAEANDLRGRLEAFEASGGGMQGAVRHKPHLLFTWLNDLIRHPRILDAVEDIIGPDILCWGTSFFIKERRNPSYVSWHQDFDLLGPRAARHHHRLGGFHRQHRSEWRDARDPGDAQARSGAAPGYVRVCRTCCREARRSWSMSMSARR